jgi:nicotinamide-nucleotide amidase
MRSERPPADEPVVSAEQLVQLLARRGLTVACAESLTGGLVCGALTDVPGASAVVRGSVVAYATDVKAGLLGVDAALLAAGGAVQADVARQMALGVCRVLRADVGVATTGVAGPDPQDGQPVGTVFLAVAHGGDAVVRRLTLEGDRATIRSRSVAAALELMAAVLESEEDPSPGRR